VHSPNGQGPVEPKTRDDVTRYLCAAAHLDDDYTDDAIREFLTERTRQIPPSPGVDAAAVLTEAVAARARRKLRDWALILLMTVFALVAPIIFTAVWILVALPSFLKEYRVRRAAEWMKFALKVGVILVLALIFLDWFGVGSPGHLSSILEPSGDRPAAAAAFVGLLLAILLTDELVVWRHLFVRFRRNRSIEPMRRRTVLRFASQTVRDNLRAGTTLWPPMAHMPDVSQTIDPLFGAAPVIVYRSYRPFVGSGKPFEAFSIAVPLEAAVDQPKRITTDDLYDVIAREVGSLRQATALAPGLRLAGLAIGGQIVVSADELIDHLGEPAAGDFLPSPEARPYTWLRKERVRDIRANPLEWARYYQYYRLETWDRDLVVSVFVHVAVDMNALYLEWTPCALLPIRKKYHEVDTMSESVTIPIGRALRQLVQLPASLPRRLVKALALTRPEPEEQDVDPDKYGVARSLRELAQDWRIRDYLQVLDQSRYLKLTKSRLVLAVSRFMRASGYSTASFDTQATTVINKSVNIAGSMTGVVVTGDDNEASSGTTSTE